LEGQSHKGDGRALTSPGVVLTRASTGLVVEPWGRDGVRVIRSTRESEARVALELPASRSAPPVVKSGLHFFDHMLETIARQSDATLEVDCQTHRYPLSHLITEDVGWTFGAAVHHLYEGRLHAGIEGSGSAEHAMDEAWAHALVSIEGRSSVSVEREAPGSRLEHVEDMLSADVQEFFSGFAQGARATLHVWLRRGEDPHHTWEAGYRAFGLALRRAMSPNPLRAGVTVGIKGTLD